MALNKKPYKGSRDFYPKDMRVRDYLFSNMRKAAESFAYEAYDGPLLEEVELYKAKSGEELINDQIYSFTDRGERFVAIRPEMTPTLARMVAGIHKQVAKPLRWYSIPNLMRYEKPQRGRVREHWQFNVDVFGAPKNLGEIEILNLAVHFLTSFGATSEMFSILVNDRRIVDAVFNTLLKLDEERSYKLYKVIDKAKKVTAEALDKMVSEILDNDQKTIFTDYLNIDNNEALIDFAKKYEIQNEISDFSNIFSTCQQLGVSEYLQYDPTIVRGLDYYTGLVFEIFDLNPANRRAIAGGGAYANLLQIFNEEPLAGIGFGLGDVTLRDFLETHNLLPNLEQANNDLFIVYTNDEQQNDSLTLANKLRAKGAKVENHLGTLKFNKIFKLAENKGHSYVAIVEECDGKLTVQVKNMQTRDAINVSTDDIDEIFQFIKIQKYKK